MEVNENLFEQAAAVKALMDQLRGHVDHTPFKGASENGRIEITLWGTGYQASVAVSGDSPQDVRDALSRDIGEALARCCEARGAFLTEGLDAI